VTIVKTKLCATKVASNSIAEHHAFLNAMMTLKLCRFAGGLLALYDVHETSTEHGSFLAVAAAAVTARARIKPGAPIDQ
jgi:hypothetical protein